MIEDTDYEAMMRRMIRAYGRRLAAGDPDGIAGALALARQLDDAITEAVRVARQDNGWSWEQLAEPAGVTRQAMYQRFARRMRRRA